MNNPASSTNVNAANVQLYGGRRQLLEARAAPNAVGGAAGQVANVPVGLDAYRSMGDTFGEYLQGLGKLMGAGDKFLRTYYGIQEERWKRDAHTALSKAYRDEFMAMSIDPMYQGQGADNLVKDWEKKAEDIYAKFYEDNEGRIPPGLMRQINDQIYETYTNRQAAIQISRQTEYDQKSRIASVNELFNTASTSQIGDWKALETAIGQAKGLFSHDPVMKQTLVENGVGGTLKAWAASSPSGFLSWAKSNKAKVAEMGGAQGVHIMGQLMRQAEAEARARASFAMSVTRFNQAQNEYFRRKENENAVAKLTDQVLAGKALDMNTPIEGSKLTPAQLMGRDPAAFASVNRALIATTGQRPKIAGITDAQDKVDTLSLNIYTKDPMESRREIIEAAKNKEISREQMQSLLNEQRQNGRTNEELVEQVNEATIDATNGNLDDQVLTDLLGRQAITPDQYRTLKDVNTKSLELSNLVGSQQVFKNLMAPVANTFIQGGAQGMDFSSPEAVLASVNGGSVKDTAGASMFAQFQNDLIKYGQELKKKGQTQVQIVNELDPTQQGSYAYKLYNAYKAGENNYRNEFGLLTGSSKPKGGTVGQNASPAPRGDIGNLRIRMGEGYDLAPGPQKKSLQELFGE